VTTLPLTGTLNQTVFILGVTQQKLGVFDAITQAESVGCALTTGILKLAGVELGS
jgi:hypothetical protein